MRTVRITTATAAAALAIVALAGCTSNPVAETVPRTAAPTAAASAPPATPSTPPPTQVAADATPVHEKCRTLVPTVVARSLVPDLTVLKGWVPEEGSPTARLKALDGTACQWTDAAGDVLEIGVAKPSAKDSTALKNDLVERSQSVPTYGGEAYFQVVDHLGQADVFRGRTWLFVRSNRFFEPGDASAVVASALDALGSSSDAAPTAAPGDVVTPAPTATPVG